MRARELEIACAAARAAGASAMAHYGRASASAKGDGSPVTAADRSANAEIRAALHEAFPNDAILSEEDADDESRLRSSRVWIVDPLDGTKEFLAQNGEFAIMIGLARRGRAVLGVVYLPAEDAMYAAARRLGAWVERDGRRERLAAPATTGRALRLISSRSHPDPLVVSIQQALAITDVRPCGSVGVKCARVADGQADLYVHPVATMSEWDTCAPEILVREAGGTFTDCAGHALRYNKREPIQPHGILACGPGVLGRVLDRIAPLYAARAVVA